MSWRELKIRHPRFLFFTILAALVCTAAGQPTAALHIVSPRSGDQIDTDMVTIRYVLAPEVAADEVPAFNLRLDDGDPVQTNDSEYTFGVMPGEHTVIVQVVDANGTPIVGAQDWVQFTVLPPQNER